MAFKEGSRQFYLNAQGRKCQYEYYTEKDGFKECGSVKRLHVHHIIPEGDILAAGDDPERAMGMVVCEKHHVRNTGEEEHSHDFSFHPDMVEAFKQYPAWKAQKNHMESITGERVTTPSPFKLAAQQHSVMREAGERYVAGTDEIDQYYIEKVQESSWQHVALTGEVRPDTAPHPRTDPSKKWWRKHGVLEGET